MPTGKVSITQLTPLLFLERSADVFPQRVAIVYGDRRLTYAEFADDAQRLASALRVSGIALGDRVAYLLPNVPEMLVAHFGVPLADAVLVAVNTRLSGAEVETILRHSGARILVADTQLLESTSLDRRAAGLEEVVAIDDVGQDAPFQATPYAELLARPSGSLRAVAGGRRRSG